MSTQSPPPRDLLIISRQHKNRLVNPEEFTSAMREYALAMNARADMDAEWRLKIEEWRLKVEKSLGELSDTVEKLSATVDRYIKARGNG